MWIVELAFELPAPPERMALRPQHRERLKAHKAAGELVMAGPLTDGTGAFMVWTGPDEESVRALMAQDPYYTAPSVSVASLREWDPLPL
jgi:uncharacterized protein YciI